MPHSLRAKLSGLRYKGILEDKDYKRLCHALDLEKAEQEPTDEMVHVETLHQVMWERDIAIEQLNELGYELGQKIEPCDDVVSRDAVLMCITGEFVPDKEYKPEELISIFSKRIRNLPSVRPQEPKTGHWIEEDVFDGDVAYRCSECNELFWLESGTPKDNEYNFCPKCGKKLVEPQESEEK